MVDEAKSPAQNEAQNLTRKLALATPLYLLVPVLFAMLPRFWDGQLILTWVALSAIGWLFALILRLPLLALFHNFITSTDTRQRATILASGPTEEPTRLIVLTIAGRDLDTAYSLGLFGLALKLFTR
jgi:hypothetical protein